VIGEHMVANALAAAACGLALGLRVEECARELESYCGRRSRMELHDAPGGLLLIDDAYNASPSSMEAALQTVRRIAGRGRRVAVLGPMAELGELASSAHQAVGCLVAALHYELLIAVGDDTGAMVRAARTAGVPPSATVEVSDPEEAAHQLIRRSRPGDVVLVKGSRVSGLDRLSELLGAREFSSRPPAAESRGNLGAPGAVMCGDGPRIEE
jgi:UDP-N-acetylmuramoyl-tripeptide--D-alanyl-D-alanine ligase